MAESFNAILFLLFLSIGIGGIVDASQRPEYGLFREIVGLLGLQGVVLCLIAEVLLRRDRREQRRLAAAHRKVREAFGHEQRLARALAAAKRKKEALREKRSQQELR